MAVIGKFRSGKSGRTDVNSQILNNRQWSTNFTGASLDTSNFETNGWKQQLIGLESVAWSIAGDWDAGKNPLDDPPGLFPREDGVDMLLYTNVTDAHVWQIPFWSCSDSKTSTSVDGKVTFDASGDSQGQIFPPVGSV